MNKKKSNFNKNYVRKEHLTDRRVYSNTVLTVTIYS